MVSFFSINDLLSVRHTHKVKATEVFCVFCSCVRSIFSNCISQYYTCIIWFNDLKIFNFVYTKSMERLIKLFIDYSGRMGSNGIHSHSSVPDQKKRNWIKWNLSRDIIIQFKKITEASRQHDLRLLSLRRQFQNQLLRSKPSLA